MSFGLFLPRRWSRQPQGAVEIDRNHAAGEITDFLLLGSVPGTPRNLANGQGSAESGLGLSRIVGTTGRGIRNESSVPGTFISLGFHTRIASPDSAVSIVCRSRRGGAGNSAIRHVGHGLVDYGWRFTTQFYGATDNVSEFGGSWSGGGPALNGFGASPWPYYSEKTLVLTSWFVGGTRYTSFWMDGRQYANAQSTTADPPAASGSRLWAGLDSLGLDSSTLIVAAFAGRLSDALAQSLSVEPYQFLRPQRPIFYSFPSGGGAANLSPPIVSSANIFHTPTVGRGAVVLSPSLLTGVNEFYAPTVSPGAVTLSVSLHSNVNYFYAATVAQGMVLSPPLLNSENSFYAHTIGVGAVTLQPSLYSSTNTFPAHTVGAAAITLTPPKVTSTNTFHAPVVGLGAVNLSASLFSSSNSFHAPVVGRGAVALLPAVLMSVNQFYGHVASIEDGPQYILAPFVEFSNQFFSAVLSGGNQPSLGAGGIVRRRRRELAVRS